jgi:hypothetical protein
MADLKSIKGFYVQNIDGDPDNPIIGDLYYNTSAGAFKVVIDGLPAASWSSGTALNEGRYNLGTASQGISTAGLAFGGEDWAGSTTTVTSTESYNGSTWTEVNELNAARRNMSSFGVQTSSICAAGRNGSPTTDAVESWDGTNWTEVAEVNTGNTYRVGLGVSNTSGLIAGGPPNATVTESWNGTSWTEVNELNTGRYGNAGSGVITAGLFIGGSDPGSPGGMANVEKWNGTSWSEEADLNATEAWGGSGGGASTAIYMGGSPPTTRTEYYDGTSWTEVADLGTGRRSAKGCGAAGTTADGAMLIGGDGYPANPAGMTNVEEWSQTITAINTVTTS